MSSLMVSEVAFSELIKINRIGAHEVIFVKILPTLFVPACGKPGGSTE